MNTKTVLGWLAIATLIWLIIEDPTGAAHVVHDIGNFFHSL